MKKDSFYFCVGSLCWGQDLNLYIYGENIVKYINVYKHTLIYIKRPYLHKIQPSTYLRALYINKLNYLRALSFENYPRAQKIRELCNTTYVHSLPTCTAI